MWFVKKNILHSIELVRKAKTNQKDHTTRKPVQRNVQKNTYEMSKKDEKEMPILEKM